MKNIRLIEDLVKANKMYNMKDEIIELERDKDGQVNYMKLDDKSEIFFDNHLNIIHYKNPNKNEEWWREYDENSNLIRYKDSNGYEEWREYDDRGRLTHFRNNKGSDIIRNYTN